jgi:polyisoprenoid-binding protein YceI
MKNILFPACAALVLGLSAFTFHYSAQAKIGSDYVIAFSSEDATGVFTKMKGDIVFDANNLPAAKFNLAVEVSSINTGNGLKNKHAKADNWFDAKKYPKIEFITSVVEAQGEAYVAKGMLTMHGISKEMSIPFTYEKAASGANIKATFDVDRTDFKIGENEKKVSKVIHLDVLVPIAQ